MTRARDFAQQLALAFVIAGAALLLTGQANYPTPLGVQNIATTTTDIATTPTTIATMSVQNVKATAGNVYGVSVQNSNASVCWLQFYNTAGTPTLGTGVVFAVAVPTSGTLTIAPGTYALRNHATGIGIGSATTATGSSACGTALAGTIFYK